MKKSAAEIFIRGRLFSFGFFKPNFLALMRVLGGPSAQKAPARWACSGKEPHRFLNNRHINAVLPGEFIGDPGCDVTLHRADACDRFGGRYALTR